MYICMYTGGSSNGERAGGEAGERMADLLIFALRSSTAPRPLKAPIPARLHFPPGAVSPVFLEGPRPLTVAGRVASVC